MELFLNILWALIATGLLWTWRSRWVFQRKRILEHPVREWTAIGVALVLLFFAVSMTDDLHADLVLFDESSTSRRGSAIEVHSHRPASPSGTSLHAAGPAVVVDALRLRTQRSFRKVRFGSEPVAAATRIRPTAARAPPVITS